MQGNALDSFSGGIMLHSNSDEQQFEELQNCLAPKIQSLQELYWNPLPIVWRPSFLRLLATRKSFQHLLTKAYSLVPSPFRLNFLNAVIENRNDIPREILAILWHQSITEDRIQTNDELKKLVRLHLSASEKEFKMKHLGAILEKLPPHLTSPLLIDSATVCQLYCLAKKTGWKMLQHTVHMQMHIHPRPSTLLRQALEEDSEAAFSISHTMAGQGISRKLLKAVIEAGASAIFRHLLEDGELSPTIVTLPELCCLLTSSQPDDISIPFLSILEDHHPGLLQGIHDVLGRNLLWYAVHNQPATCFRPSSQLTSFLLKCGCDPQNTNQLGFSWQEISNILTRKNKVSIHMAITY